MKLPILLLLVLFAFVAVSSAQDDGIEVEDVQDGMQDMPEGMPDMDQERMAQTQFLFEHLSSECSTELMEKSKEAQAGGGGDDMRLSEKCENELSEVARLYQQQKGRDVNRDVPAGDASTHIALVLGFLGLCLAGGVAGIFYLNGQLKAAGIYEKEPKKLSKKKLEKQKRKKQQLGVSD